MLPGISTEQLRSRLNRMVADGLLTRQRYREVPPRVDYELTERARDLLPVLGALARWGYEWAWGPPREGERIDVGAVFRVAPGLVELPGRTGAVELVVERADAATQHFTLTAAGDGVQLAEAPADQPSATVRGDERAWIDALGPEGERGGLRIEGDRPLAEALLDGIAAAGAARARRAA